MSIAFFYKTGTEAMFADLGHFNMRAIQVTEYFSQSPQLSFSECMHTQTTDPMEKIDFDKLCL